MTRRLALAALGAGALLLSGCATKTYGRQGSLTEFERSTLTCREIDLQIAQVDGFVNRVRTEAQFSGKDVLAFLGDFGIGNHMERSAALASARARRDELAALRLSRDCPGQPAGAAMAPAIPSPAPPKAWPTTEQALDPAAPQLQCVQKPSGLKICN